MSGKRKVSIAIQTIYRINIWKPAHRGWPSKGLLEDIHSLNLGVIYVAKMILYLRISDEEMVLEYMGGPQVQSQVFLDKGDTGKCEHREEGGGHVNTEADIRVSCYRSRSVSNHRR